MGQHALKCKQCGARSSVIDSRTTLEGTAVKRRRKCENGHRWTTYEIEIHAATGSSGRPHTRHVIDAISRGAKAESLYAELTQLSELIQDRLQRI